jgi:hypothetical protein
LVVLGRNLTTALTDFTVHPMSADNIIRIRYHNGDWHVWEGSASYDYPEIPTSCPTYRGFNNRTEAIAYAHQLETETGYVEYGVTVEEPVLHPEPEVRWWGPTGELQQKWKDNTGYVEWRRVPTVC